mmetsp:Transcript_9615/g.28636  ORF Transcript_9615/g.28636 Transcript_9615/m.28636 type:complete len:224 (-) Transcript_9615:88-759(-)
MAVIRCADVVAARLCRGGCCAHAAAPLSRETAGDAARRRRTMRSSDGPQRGVRGAARRSASTSAPALPLSVAAAGGDGAAVGGDAAAGAARLCDWARRARREHLTRRAASGKCASLSGGVGAAAAAAGADAAAGTARLCDWARRARREHLTRRAASGRCASLSGGGGGAAAAAGGADAAAGAARLSDATRCACRGNPTRRAAPRAAAVAARRWRWRQEAVVDL